MTYDKIYERYCVGCENEKYCHDEAIECDFVALLRDGVCPICGEGKIVGERCTVCGVAVYE